MVSKHSL